MLIFEPKTAYNRLMAYNWQLPDWPDFRYDLAAIEDDLFAFAEQTGRISGMLKTMPEETQIEAIISTMVAEALKTSEIEGAYLSREDVMSSIRNHLGLNTRPEVIRDKKAQGAAELMVDVRNSFAGSLTTEKLFSWHEMLLRHDRHIAVGAWRSQEAPMQVVSGAYGRETVHFEAPPSARVPEEMARFVQWFNDTAPSGAKEIRKAPVRSAVAHLYFETIHPFEDGNGRVGRAIAEKALSQTMGRPVMLSLSRTIEADKKAYYSALKEAQRSNEITGWVKYFTQIVLAAQQEAVQLIDFILKKTQFLDRYKDRLNERRLKVIRRMLDAGAAGFEGGMSAQKYISLTRTSKATATRDLQQLAEWGVLIVSGSGRGTRYFLNI